MTSVKLTVKPRTLFGRKIKTLRRQDIIPANIFGKGIDSKAIQLPLKDFQKMYQSVGETGLIDLDVEGESKTRPSLISDIHYNPVTDLPIHVDFHQVDLKQKVTAQIPLEFIGEAPAVKEKGGILIPVINEVEVEALPTDLPEKFEVDLSTLTEYGDYVTVSSIKVDTEKVTILTDLESSVVTVQEPKEEVVEEVATEEAPAEAETTKQKGEEETESTETKSE